MIYNNIVRIIYLCLIFFTFTLHSQEIGIGEWRDHLPYNNTISVAAGNNRIYCATPYSLFYYNINDNSLNRISKISGLSDFGISTIRFNDHTNILVIAYSNTNIDLVKGNTIINIPDILNSDAIPPKEKIINNIHFINEKAYFSCGFGIIVLDLKKNEISDTYYIGPDGLHLGVSDLTNNDTSFFAATENGIYSAYINDPNLAYFEAWNKDLTLPFPDAAYNHIVFYADKLFVNKYGDNWDNDTVLFNNNSGWQYDNGLFGNQNVYSLAVFNDLFYISSRSVINIYNQDLNKIESIWSYGQTYSNPSDLTVYKNKIWIADQKSGLVRQNEDNTYTSMFPNGPNTNDVFDVSVEDSHLWTVAGGRNPQWISIWNHGNLSGFIDNSWSSHTRSNTPAFDTLIDLVCVAVNPFNPDIVFAGSWHKGLAEFKKQELVNVYNPENSSLGYDIYLPDERTTKVGGLVFDDQGNLWMSNARSTNPLSVKMANGTWQSFNLKSFSAGAEFGEIIIDDYGQKWLLWRNKGSLVVFNDNGTISNPVDDRTKKLTSVDGNGAIKGDMISSIASDLDGEVWVGTDKGINVFYSPENVFSIYNFDARQILIPRNDGTGLADILLEFESVTAIEVDGANNKWIGTSQSGVYHLSSDGQEELHHFTAQNSPLFSNNVISLAIDHNTGEVYIGTDKGIISYKSTATGGGETNSDVYAYPNPVRPDYNGPIAIKGLVNNASFKITDISGNLIYSGRAEGGQGIWYGNNFEGRRAQSGVYLVFISDESGKETFVSKILFIN